MTGTSGVGMGVEVGLAEDWPGVQAFINSRNNPRTIRSSFLVGLKSIIFYPGKSLLRAVVEKRATLFLSAVDRRLNGVNWQTKCLVRNGYSRFQTAAISRPNARGTEKTFV